MCSYLSANHWGLCCWNPPSSSSLYFRTFLKKNWFKRGSSRVLLEFPKILIFSCVIRRLFRIWNFEASRTQIWVRWSLRDSSRCSKLAINCNLCESNLENSWDICEKCQVREFGGQPAWVVPIKHSADNNDSSLILYIFSVTACRIYKWQKRGRGKHPWKLVAFRNTPISPTMS